MAIRLRQVDGVLVALCAAAEPAAYAWLDEIPVAVRRRFER